MTLWPRNCSYPAPKTSTKLFESRSLDEGEPQGGDRFTVRQRKEEGHEACDAGGCLRSIDLSRAFDRVNRAKDERAPAKHQVDADLRSTVAAIHDQVTYNVQDKFCRAAVTATGHDGTVRHTYEPAPYSLRG